VALNSLKLRGNFIQHQADQEDCSTLKMKAPWLCEM
jgi:hypothetical protein